MRLYRSKQPQRNPSRALQTWREKYKNGENNKDLETCTESKMELSWPLNSPDLNLLDYCLLKITERIKNKFEPQN